MHFLHSQFTLITLLTYFLLTKKSNWIYLENRKDMVIETEGAVCITIISSSECEQKVRKF